MQLEDSCNLKVESGKWKVEFVIIHNKTKALSLANKLLFSGRASAGIIAPLHNKTKTLQPADKL